MMQYADTLRMKGGTLLSIFGNETQGVIVYARRKVQRTDRQPCAQTLTACFPLHKP
jgi:hypothetical protein